MIGQLIREKRQRKGLSLKATAERAGIHFTSLSRIENGHNTPDTETLEKVAHGLGIPLAELLGESASDFDRALLQAVRRCPPDAQRDILAFAVARSFSDAMMVSAAA